MKARLPWSIGVVPHQMHWLGQAQISLAQRSGRVFWQLREGQVRWLIPAAIEAAIAETGAVAMKDMGKVVGALKAKSAGQMDFGKASAMVKGKLGG